MTTSLDELVTPEQLRLMNEKNGNVLSKEELIESQKYALKDLAKYWGMRGGTFDELIKQVWRYVEQNGKPYFVSKVESNKIASAGFREYIQEASNFVANDKTNEMFGVTDFNEEFSEMEDGIDKNSQLFHFNIMELDGAIGGGITKGEMMSIIGNPGSMKTSLLLNGITTWLNEGGEDAFFFTIDLKKSQILKRLIMREIGTGSNMVDQLFRDRSSEYFDAKKRLINKFGGRLHLFDDTDKNWTVDDVKRMVEVNTPSLVCIDFLTQLKKPKQSDFDVVNEAMPVFKKLAHNYDCAFVILSQMSLASRSIQAAGGMGGAAKGGPVVEEYVDIELELFRDKPPEIKFGMQEIKTPIIATIKKTRKGMAGASFLLDYVSNQMRFKSTAELVHKTKETKPVFDMGGIYNG